MDRRRIIATVLTLLLCASTAWGRMTALVVGGASKASQTENTYTVNTTYDGTYSIYDNRLIGQTITVATGEAGTITAVIFNKDTSVGAQSIECRVGLSDDQINLGSNYASGSIASVGTAAGEVEVEITDGPTVTAGQNIAIGCRAGASVAIPLRKNGTSVYAGGVGYWTSSGSDWDLTGHQDTTWDFYLKYKVLQ